jgi:hypothetical protein
MHIPGIGHNGTAPAAQMPHKRFVYRCVRNCIYNNMPYRAGETIERAERNETVPYFEFVREDGTP